MLTDVLNKYGLLDKMPSTLKTSVSMLKRHYTDICESMSDKLTVSNATSYDVADCFYEEYSRTRDSRQLGQKVTAYIKGWWGHVLEGGLKYEQVDESTIKKVLSDVFDKELPIFVSKRTEIYPEYYRILALSLTKQWRSLWNLISNKNLKIKTLSRFSIINWDILLIL